MYPTLCKPRTLDIERRRVFLSGSEYSDVRYHEPMAGRSKLGMAFYLVAIGRSKLYLFDLENTNSAPVVIHYKIMESVSKVIPSRYGPERQILLSDDSELYAVTTMEMNATKMTTTVYHLASFEANSKAFVYLHQSWETYLESVAMAPPPATVSPSQITVLFHDLMAEFAATTQLHIRQQLLDELSTSATTCLLLKRLFFSEDTQFALDELTCRGLPSYLTRQLICLDDRSKSPVARNLQLGFIFSVLICYVLATLRCFHAMLFDSYALPERFVFLEFVGLSFKDLIAVFALNYRKGSVDSALTEDDRNTQRALRASIIEIQAAVLLQLYALHDEEFCAPDFPPGYRFEFVTRQLSGVSFFDLLLAASTSFGWFQRVVARAGLVFSFILDDAHQLHLSLRLYRLVSIVYLSLATNYRVREWICDDCYDSYTLLWCNSVPLQRWAEEKDVFACRAMTNICHILRVCAEGN
ncbi:hypothetical protein ACHHYP_17139 [Achlya hypogyna]|uniref:Uncharacterized protein n=1 Tax=Achlya hypogyna TaxID=1202772 RepID=A0A1V9Y540_ACHHY|nr:hypothetical protein ACHHYP_17139 [Achlya hypogyna]